jgi:hypothetical protein
MKTIFKIISTGILILMLATLVVPAGYLAWRAGQPMELPQFNGLTYYEYLNWRKGILHQMAVDYQAAHPNAKMGGGLDLCFHTETGMTLLGLPMTGFYILAGAFPNLEKNVPLRDRQYIPENVTLSTFMPDWWKAYEQGLWYMADSNIHSSVPYCRLAGTPPAPTSVNP